MSKECKLCIIQEAIINVRDDEINVLSSTLYKAQAENKKLVELLGSVERGLEDSGFDRSFKPLNEIKEFGFYIKGIANINKFKGDRHCNICGNATSLFRLTENGLNGWYCEKCVDVCTCELKPKPSPNEERCKNCKHNNNTPNGKGCLNYLFCENGNTCLNFLAYKKEEVE